MIMIRNARRSFTKQFMAKIGDNLMYSKWLADGSFNGRSLSNALDE